jgi:hypothetical protein
MPLGIAAEDEEGDEERARIEDGFRVFKTLSDISKEVHYIQDKQTQLSQAVLSCKETKALESLQLTESIILEQRTRFLHSLNRWQILNYRFAHELLHYIIKN